MAILNILDEDGLFHHKEEAIENPITTVLQQFMVERSQQDFGEDVLTLAEIRGIKKESEHDRFLLEVGSRLRQIGDALEGELETQSLSCNIHPASNESLIAEIDRVARCIFQDGEITWRRVISLLHSAYQLCKRALMELDFAPYVNKVISTVAQFLAKKFVYRSIARGNRDEKLLLAVLHPKSTFEERKEFLDMLMAERRTIVEEQMATSDSRCGLHVIFSSLVIYRPAPMMIVVPEPSLPPFMSAYTARTRQRQRPRCSGKPQECGIHDLLDSLIPGIKRCNHRVKTYRTTIQKDCSHCHYGNFTKHFSDWNWPTVLRTMAY